MNDGEIESIKVVILGECGIRLFPSFIYKK